jgi:hypothetical protein
MEISEKKLNLFSSVWLVSKPGGRVSFSTGVANPTRVEQEQPKDKNVRFMLRSL